MRSVICLLLLIVKREPGAWRALRLAKWTTAGASAGAALYGFYHNQRADEAYERLESACQAAQDACLLRLPGGAYANAELEREYQTVHSHDRRARAGLVAGQVGIATSVVLFILDLRNDRNPPNIPFEPRDGLDAGVSKDGGMMLRYRMRTR
jgi:hypothetical protein